MELLFIFMIFFFRIDYIIFNGRKTQISQIVFGEIHQPSHQTTRLGAGQKETHQYHGLHQLILFQTNQYIHFLI